MSTNCIIIGGGIAALQLAKHLHPDLSVLLLTKNSIQSSNSYRAQGGIAAAVGVDDNVHFHIKDTLQAGGYFQNTEAVYEMVYNGPGLIEELQKDGILFDRDHEGQLKLGKEGAHGKNRIIHSGGDSTGKAVIDSLLSIVAPRLTIEENSFVYELIIEPDSGKCIGVKVKKEDGSSAHYFAQHIIIATGGIGGLYSFTSNEPSISGDGIALAYRAGAEIADMEFVQFHPTLLAPEGKPAGLVSEAVRGAGGQLVDEAGIPVMPCVHPLGDLAPRHIVAHELFKRRAAGDNIYLDISKIDSFEENFPSITSLCKKNNIDIQTGRLPVMPGCHFLMGGIVTDTNGLTTIPGLYAIGETAAAGVHGTNRLASNSLLEGLYHGKKTAQFINSQPEQLPNINKYRVMENKHNRPKGSLPEKIEIRKEVMKHLGIIRSRSGLLHLRRWLRQYGEWLDTKKSFDPFSASEIQTIFMLQTATVMTASALWREESRGAHIRADFPAENPDYAHIHAVQTKHDDKMRCKTFEYDKTAIHA